MVDTRFCDLQLTPPISLKLNHPKVVYMTVRYLRDIIKSAKLFIRPLQADIESNEHVDTEVCIEGTAWATGIALLLYLLLLCLL